LIAKDAEIIELWTVMLTRTPDSVPASFLLLYAEIPWNLNGDLDRKEPPLTKPRVATRRKSGKTRVIQSPSSAAALNETLTRIMLD
jgi:hypothetical protein